ncbi:MAG: glycine--tRNA ligase [Bacteroidetes bacterium]|nr:glycine--tRNA ligase [Bacteroidota bacterium]
MANEKNNILEKIVSLAKRRGFVFQSSEIYGGINGCWDFGPLGVEMLNNIKQSWWKSMTFRKDIEGVDASILMHPKVWEASGHVANFSDPMVDCKDCKARFRVDTIEEEMCANKAFQGRKAIKCQQENKFTEPRTFNLMFKTFVGPVEDSSAVVYIRPETAQGIFTNFLNIQSSSRQKIPFGIAQVGKAFRNEINTKNFLFRTREFEQMEMQYFVKPGDDEKWFDYWKDERMNWFIDHGINQNKLQWRKHEKLAHYAKNAFDIEFEFPFGWGEIEGIHNRTDFDLSQHEEYSGKSLKYFDESTKEKFTPFVIETSAGASRSFMAFLCAAYEEELAPTADGKEDKRVVLKLHPKIAPIKIAVLPLVNRDGMDEKAKQISDELQKNYKTFYDDSGAIGRRYRRQDEIGTPFCVTIDSDTMKDDSVTIRERDSMKQTRISSDKISNYLFNAGL